jgi:uncharacterized membrane-anchored protein YjiN (DUF445 family)
MLERQMQEMRDLPERVTSLESQVLQLRQEMRDEFSATRSAFRSELASKGELAQAVTTLRAELVTKSELAQAVTALRGELATKGELGQAVTTLRGEIAAAVTTLSKAIADTNTHMRTLHEEAISRIATMGEGRQPGKKR